jgi:NADP-dependent 3-hydroxy acid dehydrogenase YdfG
VKLPGASVLLTGASGGIGDAVALELYRHGARLTLTGRRTDRLAALAARTGARTVACDLADRPAVERLACELGPVDVLVANAGVPAGGPIGDHSVGDIDTALDVNLRAPIVLARILVESMIARGGGHIVFMASLSGKSASPGGSLYSATKFGLRGFALGLRQDLHAHGVGVSTIFPGFISDAGMFAESGATLPRMIGTRTPQDVARAVVEAIEEDRGEIDVAPLGLRVGARLSGLAPGLSARVQRRFGAAEMSSAITTGQARARAGRAARG